MAHFVESVLQTKIKNKQTMESGSIGAWHKQPGDAFAPGDLFCSVETDKATVDFEAQDEGYVAKLLVDAGTDVAVGAPILITVDDAASVPAFSNYQLSEASGSATTVAATTAATPVTSSPPPPPPTPSPAPATATATTSTSTSGDRVFASPKARVLAKELGYSLANIRGSGPGGRILADDVKEYVPAIVATDASTSAAASTTVSAPAAPSLVTPPVIPGAGYTDYVLSDSAKAAAAALVSSKRNVPHYYLTVDVSVDELLQVRKKLNANLESTATIGVYEFLIKAAAKAMHTIPSANASWMGDVVRVYDSVHMNVVVGSGETLSTPVLYDCGSKGLAKLSADLKAAMKGASSTSSDLGTFTIVNLGMYGIKACAPIIREPQACALAIGALENRIVPADPGGDDDDKKIYKQSVRFTATLSCDHRVVDGAVGAQWLAAFKAYVENPSTLLL
jgi:pyruvate dehydrogenase E2 component (dihydrolipoamide acetyltransferase)